MDILKRFTMSAVFALLLVSTSAFADNNPDDDECMRVNAVWSDTKSVQSGKHCFDAPAARGYARMVFDEKTRQVFLFGGFSEFGWVMDVLDVWAMGLRKPYWQKVGDMVAQDYDALALDSQSRQVIIYNPFGSNGIETWAFDIDAHTWKNKAPKTDAPPARWGSRMAYDAESDRIILFGGSDLNTAETLNDTWAYDYETNSWTEMDPFVRATPHHYADMVYVPSLDRVVMFGGMVIDESGVGQPLNDMWAYDFNEDTWEELQPLNVPQARAYHTLAYDARQDLIVMYGGVLSEEDWPNEPTIDETWVYDVAAKEWSQVTLRWRTPGDRAWHQMVGTKLGSIMFGGGDSRWTYTNDTWLFLPPFNAWIKLR